MNKPLLTIPVLFLLALSLANAMVSPVEMKIIDDWEKSIPRCSQRGQVSFFASPTSLNAFLPPTTSAIDGEVVDFPIHQPKTTITDNSATLSLHNGWNLASIPIKPDNTAIENVLSSVAGKYISVWAYDNVNQIWTSYNPSVPSHLNDLHNLDEKMGFWIEMNETSDLTVAGTRPAKTVIPIYEGWNYLGYPHNESQDIGNAFDLVENTYFIIWKYDSEGNYISYSPGNDPIDKFLAEPGYGYGINVTKDKTWVFTDKYAINEVSTVSKIGNSIISRILADSQRNAECRYSFSDEDYDSMPYSFEGNEIQHSKTANFETGLNAIYIRCEESGIKDTSSYVYNFDVLEPTIQGVLYDSNSTNGTVSNAEISFINMENYTANFNIIGNLSDDYSTYINSTAVDAVTNESGNYAYALDNGKYSMFISRAGYYNERNYNLLLNESHNNITADESMIIQQAAKGSGNPHGDGDYNVEGHILYRERYNNQGHGNKYVCGETIKFVMFGIGKNINESKNVTFLIEDHSNGGAWNGVTRYIGNLSNPAEVLTINPGDDASPGVKSWKVFSFKIPCDWPKINTNNPKSRYDIHAYNEEKGKWHMIGVWFLMNGTPTINVSLSNNTITGHPAFGTTDIVGFTNESIQIFFESKKTGYSFGWLYPFTASVDTICTNESNFTVPCLEDGYYRIAMIPDPPVYPSPYNVTVDQGNGVVFTVPAGSTNFTVSYNQSDYYNFTLYSNEYGNAVPSTSTAEIWITEEEADAIGNAIYDLFGYIMDFDILFETEKTNPHFNITVDRFERSGTNLGDEYITPNDPNADEMAFYPSDWKEQLNSIIYGCSGPEYIKPIEACTASEYDATLTQYLTYLQNNCSMKSKKDEDKPYKKDKSAKVITITEAITPEEHKNIQNNKPSEQQTQIQIIKQPELNGIRVIKSHKKSIFDLISEFFENIFSST